MKLDAAIREFVTQIVARDIAAGVELARSIGYAMPKDFAVGVRFVEYGAWTRLRMRLDDTSYDSIVHLPDLNGRMSFTRIDKMWKTAWECIHTDALTLAQIWIDKHPEAQVGKKGEVKALAILAALQADEALYTRWMQSCHERAKHFTYR